MNFDHQTGDHEPGGDQQLIAHAPDDLAWLVERVERMRAALDAAKRAGGE